MSDNKHAPKAADKAAEAPKAEEVKAEAPKAEAPKEPEKTPEPKAAEAPKAEAPKYPYAVSEGVNLTSKRGILSAGDEVKAEWLGGGQSAIDALVKAGKVVKG